MERVLITGGSGFIGSHLARELFLKGYHARIADIEPRSYVKEKHCNEQLTLDLRIFENCLTATKNVDVVYNLAANMGGIGFITRVGAEVMRDNILINANMLEASRLNRIGRYLFSSSACVYPTYRQMDTKVVGLKEEHAYPADPDSFYGWEKLYSEKMCEAYHRDHGMDIRIVRFHNIYGPEGVYDGGREKSPAALCRKVAETVNNGKIVIWGDGKQTRSYCYIDDAVRGTMMLMKSDWEKPMNIGSDRLVTIDELADEIIRISGKNLTKEYDSSAAQGVRGRNADIRLAKKVLDWEPEVTLEDGLARTYKWIEDQVMKKRS
jgi:GDP-D-mannose 3',5'-epimerase